MAEEEKDTAPEEVKEDAADSGKDAVSASGEGQAETKTVSAEVAEAPAESTQGGEKASTEPSGEAAKPAGEGEAAKPAGEGEAASPAGEGAATAVEEKGKGGEKPAGQDIFLALDPTEGEKPKILKAKGSKNVSGGIVHVLATFNNTIVTVTDRSGNVIGWSSAGKMGFKGSRKSTAYAAQLVSQDACRQAMGHGFREADVRVKGPGSGRESAVRAVQAIGIDILSIRDVTPVPHNGCRPPKARRV